MNSHVNLKYSVQRSLLFSNVICSPWLNIYELYFHLHGEGDFCFSSINTPLLWRAQQNGGSGKGGGNSAEQGIGQSQSSKQNSQVVSGGDTVGSGNNINVQSQTNSGSNAAAQS